MHLLDCDPSPIQSPLHPSGSNNVLNLLHISVAYGRILSMSKRSSDRVLGWPQTLCPPYTSPCMSTEAFELAIPLTSVSFAQLFRSLRNTPHFAWSHLSPSAPLCLEHQPAQASNCLLPTSRRITSLTDPKLLLLRFPCVLSPPHVLPTPQPWPTNYDPFASSSLSSLAFFPPFLFRSSGGGSPAMLSSNDNVLSYPPAVVADRRWKPIVELAPNCPRCHSSNTKFCYYNNYSLSQPRYFCKGCRRYWTKGGSLRNVPVGGGCRKSRRAKSTRPSTVSPVAGSFTNSSPPLLPCPIRPDLMLNEMALYAKYSNQRPQTEPGPVTAESQLAEGDHEPMGSVGTSSESSSCNQVFSQPMEEEEEEAAIALLSQVDPPYNIEHSCLPVDLTATVEWPMQPVTNSVSLDCPGASGLIYEEFESVAVGGMHHQQSPLNDDWSLPDYSSLEPFYRC
ncbi:hypothetical protein B296_00040477 [Ensete ventricosum]|uniref:Dof zinc finger protein n=1 Tax=Ensete ventricosum TaxID=4639 RepID=A0A426X7Z3_ENSVE|nr:hypothetical protein B296_00040477 [Ensete ventricosum]